MILPKQRARHRLLGAALSILGLVAHAAGGSAQTPTPTPTPTPTTMRRDVIIGTGTATGLYLPVGAAICRLVNEERERHGLRCLVEATAGSGQNLKALRTGDLDAAIVQSDWQQDAMTGQGRFEGISPFSDLRAVLGLHAESLTLLARPEAGITSFADLAGKRVNIGPPNSAPRMLFDTVAEAFGLSHRELGSVRELPPDQQGEALCSGRIDVAVFAVGHPNGTVRDLVASCGAVIVPIVGEAMAGLTTERPSLVESIIPARFYPGLERDVPTVGLMATLVTTAQADDRFIQELVQAVLKNHEALRAQHPGLSGLALDVLADGGRVAPLHPAAEKALRDAALLDKAEDAARKTRAPGGGGAAVGNQKRSRQP